MLIICFIFVCLCFDYVEHLEFMAGLYFHIPFCKRICAYCDFYRSADLRYMSRVVEMMHEELDSSSLFITDHALRTIYFGGGTPSLLHPNQFQRFIVHATEVFDCSGVEEITIEANPDDVTADFVSLLRSTAVNRISLGVQSFNDAELKFMNRRHDSATAVEAVKRLQDAGFDNITIDLIFGVDGYGEDILSYSLSQAVDLGVKHISAYHLTIEPSTTFHRRLCSGRMCEVDEKQSLAEFALIERVLCGAGFEHYEVSNYALPGYRSKHNSSYWQGVQYLGIGPGAHSFNGQQRRWCSQSLEDYISKVVHESEQLTERDHFNEYVMTSLRRAEGLDLKYIKSRFGEKKSNEVIQQAKIWIEQGDLVQNNDSLYMPTHRFMISDAVIETLFEG